MKRLLLITLISVPLLLDAQIWIENFDGSNTTNPPVFTYQSFCTSRDYLDIVCDDGNGCANEMNSDYLYINSDNQYLGARDTDHNGCTADLTGENVTFNGIDISSCAYPSVVYFCFTVAESANLGGPFGAEWGTSCGCEDTWDGNTSVMVSASIDGGGFLPVTAIEAIVGSDSAPGIDTNCDGKSDDPGEPEVTSTFTQYCFELPALGTTLDLDLELIGFNTGGEDVAIDDISVYCEMDPTTLPAGATTLDACTPFVPVNPATVWCEDFDGSNGGIAFSFPCIIDDSRDYFGVVCLAGGPCGSDDINADYSYGNVTGSFFGARDINGDPCMTDSPVTSTAAGIDISGCTSSLYLCFDIAESDTPAREGSDTWDGNQSNPLSNSFVSFDAIVDGVPYGIASFAATGNNNSGPALDGDCDGTGEGQTVEHDFASFCFEIPATGNNLDISFTIGGLNTDGDDVAIDNICVLCTDDISELPTSTSPSCTFILPVEITTFTGKIFDDSSVLNWQTVHEVNNDYFEVQHSINGRDFTTIEKVTGNGNSYDVNDYEYIHKDVKTENNYYRLKQVDYNGAFQLSNVLHLQKKIKKSLNAVYPNPAQNTLVFEGAPAVLTFYDVHGKQVKQLFTNEGKNSFDISDLDIGIYMISILDNYGNQEYKNFIKTN